MARIVIKPQSVVLWASQDDTSMWASQGKSWPVSTLAGRRLRAEFDRGGLVDLQVDGAEDDSSMTDQGDVDGNEFSALCADLLSEHLPTDHPAYEIAVAQHRT